jgi:hypothetical protein
MNVTLLYVSLVHLREEERSGEERDTEGERELPFLFGHGKLPQSRQPLFSYFFFIRTPIFGVALRTNIRKTCVYEKLDCVFKKLQLI